MIYCKHWLSGHSILDPRAYASDSASKELASLPGRHAQKSSGVDIAATGKVLTFTDMVQCEVNLQLGRILRILFTVSNVDRDIGRYSGRYSGRHSVDTRSTLGRHSGR